jgi:large subunit ribosomal protein L25
LEQIELKTKIRKTVGNGPARALRREGKVPAVLYGPKIEPILLAVDIKDIEQILKQGTIGQALLNLVIQNGEKVTKAAMIKELQRHPVSGEYLHIDFYEIDMQRKISTMVPVVVKGHSAGVEVGGIMQIVRRELEVLCLPSAIPEAFEVDITELDIGDSVHVQEIQLPTDVELPEDVDFTVVTILAPKVEEEVVEEEELEEGEEEEAAEEGAEGEAAGEGAPSEESKED